MSRRKKDVPPSVARRLPRYYACLQDLGERHEEWVSSREIADRLGLTSSTVRQDLMHFDCTGIAKKGYRVCCLERTLSAALGAEDEVRIVIVGAGHLGKALAMHGEFRNKGFRICGIFDSNPKIQGEKVGSLIVQAMDSLPDVMRSTRADIGIIAVPGHAAQQVADLLIICGIGGLLNLSHVHVIAPKTVSVVDARITASLQELFYVMRSNPFARNPWKSTPARGTKRASRTG